MKSLLAALGVALIAGGEAFTVLAGADALAFWNNPVVFRPLAFAGLGLSALFGGWIFRRILRLERSLATGTAPGPTAD